jgi:hypothetical protein
VIVWSSRVIDGIMEMFTADVVYEPSVARYPWFERAVGKEAGGIILRM